MITRPDPRWVTEEASHVEREHSFSSFIISAHSHLLPSKILVWSGRLEDFESNTVNMPEKNFFFTPFLSRIELILFPLDFYFSPDRF